jgi:cytochrome bd-type quinol oxidase subunit 2
VKRSLSKITVIRVLLFSSVSLAFAQLDVGEILDGFEGTGGSLSGFIVIILNWLIGFAGVICVVMIIVGGYSYMTAGGDESKVKDASKTLTNAIIGLVICFIAVILVNYVLENFLTPNTPPTPTPPPAPGPGPTPVPM